MDGTSPTLYPLSSWDLGWSHGGGEESDGTDLRVMAGWKEVRIDATLVFPFSLTRDHDPTGGIEALHAERNPARPSSTNPPRRRPRLTAACARDRDADTPSRRAR
jgi:hypothetical protein